MKSLNDLNTYNNTKTINFTDERPPSVKFDSNMPVDQSITILEGQTSLSTVGINITEIINPISANVTYTIDVSALSGCTVTWTSLPSKFTVINSAPGVYILSGIETADDWELIKQANIVMPPGTPFSFTGTFSYTSTIDWIEGSVAYQGSWITVVTVTDLQIFGPTLKFSYTRNATSLISNTPQLNSFIDYASAIWTVTITPSIITSITNFTSTSTDGGTFSVNATTKVITIVGNRTQVNGHLTHLNLVSNDIAVDFSLDYHLTNSLDSATDTASQRLKNADIEFLTNPAAEFVYYIEDAEQTLVPNVPQITDTDGSPTANYVLSIYVSNTNAITEIGTTLGASGTTGINYNPTLKTLSLSGNKSTVNSLINGLYIKTATDFVSSFAINYTVNLESGQIATKSQTALCGSSDQDVLYMNQTRYYVTYQLNSIFSTLTPIIDDFDTNPSNVYSIIFYCDHGDWAVTTVGVLNPKTVTITGNKDWINSRFSQIVFYPDYDLTGSTTFTYTQLKNGVIQTSQTVALEQSGTGTFTGTRSIDFTVSGTWSPTTYDVKYGQITDLLVVAGGGGGRNATTDTYGIVPGIGGGGGQVVMANNIPLSSQSYTITVGAGGPVNTGFGGNSSAFGVTAVGGFASLAGSSVRHTFPDIGLYFRGAGGGYGGTGVTLTAFDLLNPTWPNTPNNINASYVDIPDGVQDGYGGSGGLGPEITGYYALPVVAGSNYSGYGGGGGGGVYGNISTSNLGNGGGYQNYGTGGYLWKDGRYQSAVKPDKYLSNGSRDPNVAGVGGGGGGGGASVAAQGGDGVVRFRIGPK